MTEDDRKVYNNLPDEIIIYRGYYNKVYQHGISFTLDYKIADWFSNRFGKRGKRVAKKVLKKPQKKLVTFLCGKYIKKRGFLASQ